MSLEIRPLVALTPPHTKNVLCMAPLSVVAGDGMPMPMVFATLSIVYVLKIMGGLNAARGLISRDIVNYST